MDNSKIVGGSSANYRQLSSESPHRLNTYPISIEYYREHVDIAGALVCLRTNFSAKFLLSLFLVYSIVLHLVPGPLLVMSYPQVSRSQYEASPYANSFIDSDFPQSDESSDALSSQSIAQSTPASDTSPPPRYPRAPELLQRVGKLFQPSYILYNCDKTDLMMETSRIQFVKWWLMTEFGSKKELQKSIRWDTIQKKSDVWSSFDQVANTRTGEPKVMCNRCQSVVVHPRFNRSGPSPMKNHLNNAYCSQPRKNTKQSIDQLLREMVSLS